MYDCKKYEVRICHRGILINAQAIKIELLKKGFLDALAEEYALMPMFRGEIINIQIKPIKKNNLDMGFRNDKMIVEVIPP